MRWCGDAPCKKAKSPDPENCDSNPAGWVRGFSDHQKGDDLGKVVESW
jgi:hypothetical protein